MMDKKYHIKRIVKFLNDTKIYLNIDQVILLINLYSNNKIIKRPILPYLLYTHFNIIY